MKIESMDPFSSSQDRLNDNQAGGGLILSSAHSSVYSQNLGRTISMASIGTSQNSKQNEVTSSINSAAVGAASAGVGAVTDSAASVSLMKTFDESKMNIAYAETSSSTLV